MSILKEIREKNKVIAEAFRHEGMQGLKEVLKDSLYAESAHFIYELLQNAEDAKATRVKFCLDNEGLTFEHDGRDFNENDLWGITSLGLSEKKNDETQIGKFGLGFKSVYAYTNTPSIWSPSYSFRIEEWVLPHDISRLESLGDMTRFFFPFDRDKQDKHPETSHREIKARLEELTPETLLFLSNISSLSWQSDGTEETEISRKQGRNNGRITITGKSEKGIRSRKDFLRFFKKIKIPGSEEQQVGIAYCLVRSAGPRPRKTKGTGRQNAGQQEQTLRVTEADPGTVSVFFPASRETSNLRFHVHAPFKATLSRDSVQNTPENAHLFLGLANLAAESLEKIRDLGYLDTAFLAVLPNNADELPDSYCVIRDEVIDAMRDKSLTPTFSKKHAPAKTLLQAERPLKGLLSDFDLNILVDGRNYSSDSYQWVASSPQKNSRSDKFLSALRIREWNSETFLEFLIEHADCESGDLPKWLVEIFSTMDDGWHQKFYAFLSDQISANENSHDENFNWDEWEDRSEELENLPLILGKSGGYFQGSKLLFPKEEWNEKAGFRFAREATYQSGTNKKEKEKAEKFLRFSGVKEIGEREEVEAILHERYSKNAHAHPEIEVYRGDLIRFMDLLERDPSAKSIFRDFFIFCCDIEHENGVSRWLRPGEAFLDSPLRDTGLSRYFDQENAKRVHQFYPLGQIYKELLSEFGDKPIDFCIAVGANDTLPISLVRCFKNPEWDSKLRHVGGSNNTTTGHNHDYMITGLEDLLESPNLAFSRTLWKTMERNSPWSLQASYSMNRSGGSAQSRSQLVHVLTEIPWVPQVGEDRATTFAIPFDAVRDLLPPGFETDWDDASSTRWHWINSVRFGRGEAARLADEGSKRESTKRKLEHGEIFGITTEEQIESTEWFVRLSPTERQQVKSDHESRSSATFEDLNRKERPLKDRDRRSALTKDRARTAPRKETERRQRSISVGHEETKEEARTYLRSMYTTRDNEMLCQLCHREMPFKTSDGRHYFEATLFLYELDLQHEQNYLALCPNDGAMFKHANESRETLLLDFQNVNEKQDRDPELEVILAGQVQVIRFHPDHFADLLDVIEVEEDGEDI